MLKKIIILPVIMVLIGGCSFAVPEYPLNITGDPFGTPPKESFLNCGPEYRYKFDAAINSKNDFMNFVKNNEINQWVRLDNFKDVLNGEINWENVLRAVEIETIGGGAIYSVEYTPGDCLPAQKFTLKMTNDGHASVYGCCGK